MTDTSARSLLSQSHTGIHTRIIVPWTLGDDRLIQTMNGPIVTSGSAIHKYTCTHDFSDLKTTMVEARGATAASSCAKMVEKEIKHGCLVQ